MHGYISTMLAMFLGTAITPAGTGKCLLLFFVLFSNGRSLFIIYDTQLF